MGSKVCVSSPQLVVNTEVLSHKILKITSLDLILGSKGCYCLQDSDVTKFACVSRWYATQRQGTGTAQLSLNGYPWVLKTEKRRRLRTQMVN